MQTRKLHMLDTRTRLLGEHEPDRPRARVKMLELVRDHVEPQVLRPLEGLGAIEAAHWSRWRSSTKMAKTKGNFAWFMGVWGTQEKWLDTVYWPTLRDMYIVLVHAAGLDEHAAALIVRREAQCMIAQKRYEWQMWKRTPGAKWRWPNGCPFGPGF